MHVGKFIAPVLIRFYFVAAAGKIAQSNALWASCIVGFAMSMMSGTLYGFGAFQTDIKQSMNLSQEEMEAMGVSMHLGLYLLKPIAGMFYDRVGPRLTGV